jgi:hypothetical protein
MKPSQLPIGLSQMGTDCFGGSDFGPVSGAEQKDLVLKSEEPFA